MLIADRKPHANAALMNVIKRCMIFARSSMVADSDWGSSAAEQPNTPPVKGGRVWAVHSREMRVDLVMDSKDGVVKPPHSETKIA